jgi:hypothetical protein
MTKRKPPTIYTCISDDDADSRVIRWSTDPRALDSLPTNAFPTPKLVSESRVAFVFDDCDPDEYWSRSCRGRLRSRHEAGLWCGQYADNDNGGDGALWLVGDIE